MSTYNYKETVLTQIKHAIDDGVHCGSDKIRNRCGEFLIDLFRTHKDFDLLNFGFDDNEHYQFSNNALDLAARIGYVPLLRYLKTSRGIYPNEHSLFEAVLNKNMNAVNWLIEVYF